jgi:hypothetical protein
MLIMPKLVFELISILIEFFVGLLFIKGTFLNKHYL